MIPSVFTLSLSLSTSCILPLIYTDTASGTPLYIIPYGCLPACCSHIPTIYPHHETSRDITTPSVKSVCWHICTSFFQGLKRSRLSDITIYSDILTNTNPHISEYYLLSLKPDSVSNPPCAAESSTLGIPVAQ